MTPTEQDNEIREKLADALRTGYHGIAETKVINHIMQLITADRKRVALEARIDELEQLQAADMNLYKNVVIAHRIAALTAKQEEV